MELPRNVRSVPFLKTRVLRTHINSDRPNPGYYNTRKRALVNIVTTSITSALPVESVHLLTIYLYVVVALCSHLVCCSVR